MVILEIYIFQSPVKKTTQSKPLPLTEQTTQLYTGIWKEFNNSTTKKTKQALITVHSRPLEIHISFS